MKKEQDEKQFLGGLLIGIILVSLICYLISTVDTWNILFTISNI